MKTWGTLKEEILALGFAKQQEYQKNAGSFIQATNRAMIQVATTVKPILGRYVISRSPMPNALPNPLYMMDIYRYPDKMPRLLQADNVKAFYFECDGNGAATVSNGSETIEVTMESDGKFEAYKGLISGSVSIEFGGEHSYGIRNLALYSQLRSPTDIPTYAQYVEYDMAEITKENGRVVFHRFAEDKPIKQGSFSSGEAYKTVGDYKRKGKSIIMLNYFDEGEFEIWFEKYPAPITNATPDDYPLELDDDACALLPYLVGYDVWIDDSPERATDYMNVYQMKKEELLGASSETVAQVVVSQPYSCL